ncbi:MAG: aspartyl/asparaginyl beta-hydroxylase domain-containing protein [Pseudolabrys sp.]|nr:aspartyl/asparaginyl beta-hydroxylase domain-containing protein [Pseudolabrys sp.]MBV9261011.1 aspartyl/asparaginyl beta-hydroxylase domain-containing protein [Pseudolabrys sp.]
MTITPDVTTSPAPLRKPIPLKKKIKYVGMGVAVLVLGYFFPKFTIFYALCSLYDVSRNRPLDGAVLRQYFLINGALNIALAPFNILLDILTLPFINKGIYKLEDFPAPYRDEIERLIETAKRENLVGQLEARAKEMQRTMIFFKWYGENVGTFLKTPMFHTRWKYIETIGVSIFNKKVSTSRHFGPIRPTLRVLYNLNDMDDHSAYIEVGGARSYWKENKLFIFDDTLMHQSFNETDKIRYCLFVDILRPSLFPWLLRPFVKLVNIVFKGANFMFYKQWKIIQ